MAKAKNRRFCQSEECKKERSRLWPSRLAEKKHFDQIRCLYCGVEFIPILPHQRCCCLDHGNKFNRISRKNYITYTCKYCNQEYHPKSKERDQYCCREHSDLHKKQIVYEKKVSYQQSLSKICPYCREQFTANTIATTYCSLECARKQLLDDLLVNRKKNHIDKTFICKECGVDFIPEFGNKHRNYCSDKCGKKHGRRINKAIREAREKGSTRSERFDPITILERDHWRCQICGIKTPAKLRGTIKDNAPEVDHIVPLALGGDHTMINTQCLCRRCNQIKGASVKGQLRLM